MATVNEALNNIRAQVNSGRSVGNGECYALASYYETMISPDSTVGLGAGVNNISGAIGDTIKAANIGNAYNWSANGWDVRTSNDFKVGQILTIRGTAFNVYGHVVIVDSINGDRLTVLEQNVAGKRYPLRNTYSASEYRKNIVHYITPKSVLSNNVPSGNQPVNYAENGIMTVTVDAINVRRAPNIKGEIVARYTRGESFKYDTVIIDFNGFVWVSYVGGSGKRNYVATGATQNGKRFGDRWGTFK